MEAMRIAPANGIGMMTVQKTVAGIALIVMIEMTGVITLQVRAVNITED
jgi:hypothetical protein